jgi:hypothetical protein
MKVYLILFLCVFSIINACISDEFMNGVSQDVVIEMLGNPTREIKTGDGVLLFYGSVFLEIADQGVLFINVNDEDALESRRIADAKRGVYWGKNIIIVDVVSDENRRPMTDQEVDEWTEIKRRQRDMVVETRVRRFLLTRTLKNVLARIPVIQVASQTSDFDRNINLHNLAASGAVSIIGLKDSHGVPVPAVGEDSGYTDRYVSYNESFFEVDDIY